MIINLKSQTDLSGLYVVFYGSTNLETKGIYGISHLLEHLLCKNIDHLQDEYETMGIDWNAYTSSNEIVFHLTGLDSILKKYKYNFVDLLTNFNITKEQFENERQIVLEEYADYFNNQTYSHYMNLFRKKYNKFDAIGLRQDLESLTFMDCIKFFEKQFQKPSKIINVSKKNPFEYDVDFDTPKYKQDFKAGDYKADIEVGNDFKDKTSMIILSPVIKSDYPTISFINAMLSSGLTSPLYQEVREKRGLAYYVSMSLDRIGNEGINEISTLTSNKNVDKVIECVNEVIGNPDKYMTKERFDIIKSSYLIRFKKQEINRFSNVNKWIGPKEWNLSEIIRDITFDDVMKVYKNQFNIKDWYVSNDKKEFKL